MRKKRFFFIRHSKKCTNPKIGMLFEEYLDKTLHPAKARQFQDHMYNCRACAFQLGNYLDILKAAKNLDRLPKGLSKKKMRACGQLFPLVRSRMIFINLET